MGSDAAWIAARTGTLYKVGRIVRPNYDCYSIGIENKSGEVMYSSAGWGGFNHFGFED